MKTLYWTSLTRTPIRYWSSNEATVDVDKYRLEIRPCVEPDGKVHFAEHTLYRNDEIISVDIYQYNPHTSDIDLISLGQNRVIRLN